MRSIVSDFNRCFFFYFKSALDFGVSVNAIIMRGPEYFADEND